MKCMFALISLLVLGVASMQGMQKKKPLERLFIKPCILRKGEDYDSVDYRDVIYKTRFQATQEGRDPDAAELTLRIELARGAAQVRGEDPDVAEKQVREEAEELRTWWAKMFGKK